MTELLQAVQQCLIRRQDVERITGLGHTAIRERLNPQSVYYDETFPRPVRLGAANSVRFVESEVVAWVQAKIKASRAATQSDRTSNGA